MTTSTSGTVPASTGVVASPVSGGRTRRPPSPVAASGAIAASFSNATPNPSPVRIHPRPRVDAPTSIATV